jgi:hypothetical protein
MSARPGRTEKLTISLDKREALVMKRRAKRLHSGNLSAAFSEFAKLAIKEEALDRLLAHLPPATAEGLARAHDELLAALPPVPTGPPRKRRRSAS